MRYRLEPQDLQFPAAVAGIHNIEFFLVDYRASDGALFFRVFEAWVEKTI